jgi:2,3-bisphosphoglycerate-independent phosphoglycerate mutase
MKKIIFLVCDGMGDIPQKALGGKSPLEAANTPNMDRLSKEGVNGMIEVLGKGIRPNSDQAHLTLFGYDLKTDYPKRGPIEAAGVGIKLKQGDVAVRSNIATVDKDLTVKDRRAGRMQDNHAFTKDLQGIEIEGIKFIVKSGTGHRVSIVMRGKGLSDKISNSDVHYVSEEKVIENWEGGKVNTITPMDDTPEAKFTAKIFQKFLEMAHASFEKNPENEKREKEGKLRGNYLLTRGPGYYKKLKSFEERYGLKSCCIAGAGLYKGLGAISGMDIIPVAGATGLIKTDLKAKIDAALEQIKKYDFAYVHMKGADICGENGDCEGKKEFIERIDQSLEGLKYFDGVIAITADHSTPCSHKDHSGDPVPILIHGKGIIPDDVDKFDEIKCKNGSLGTMQGSEVMSRIMDLAK